MYFSLQISGKSIFQPDSAAWMHLHRALEAINCFAYNFAKCSPSFEILLQESQ